MLTVNNLVGLGAFEQAVAGLLLDGQTVGAAYSFRKLLTAYAGNCVEIRRSSDDTAQTFGFVSNVVDTAGIATFIGGGSGFIRTLLDQSGNGLDLTQTTLANQPLYVASGINAKPTMRFDGAADVIVRASVTGTSLVNSNEGTIVFVQNQNNMGANNTTIHWDTGSVRINCHATYSDVIYFDFGSQGAGGRVNVAQPSGWDDAGHITELYRTTGNTQAIVVDGVELVSASRSDAVSGTATLNIGSIQSTDTPFRGDLSEIFTLKTDIGSPARTILRANIGSFYGITV